MSRPKYWAVVPAAGAGRRMGSVVPKQYLELAGRTILERTLSRIGDHPAIDALVVALSPEDDRWRELTFDFSKPLYTVEGGKERCDSVLNAVNFLRDQAAKDDWVLVHDAARPCLTGHDIDHLLQELGNHSVGGLLGLPIHDTVKRADARANVLETVPRENLWRALTPQMFRYGLLRDALEQALANGAPVTDEASAVEHAGHQPKLVEGQPSNIKITRPADVVLAEFFLLQS